jgi:hypothetical protein
MRPPKLLAPALAAVLLLPLAVAEAAAVPACGGHDLIAEMKQNAPQDYASLQAEAEAIVNGEGLLWRVEKPGGPPSYLFGTIHITDARITDLPAPARAALAAARVVAVESVEALDRQTFAKDLDAYKGLMYFQDGRTLSQHLTEERRGALAKALQSLGADIEAFGNAKPWLVATALALPACETARQAELAVVDGIIVEKGKEAGVPVVSLETVEEQFSAFDAIPLDLQAEYLIASARLYPRMEDLFATMAELYLRRRVALIEALSRVLGDRTGISEEGYAAFNDLLVDRRNKVMVARAVPLIDEGATFIAVGALHLIGDKGLVALLRDEGYAVTRVY